MGSIARLHFSLTHPRLPGTCEQPDSLYPIAPDDFVAGD